MGRHRFTMLAVLASVATLAATPAADASGAHAKKAKICTFTKKGKIVRRACHKATAKTPAPARATSGSSSAAGSSARPVVSSANSTDSTPVPVQSSHNDPGNANSGGGSGGGGGGPAAALAAVGSATASASTRVGVVAGSAPVWELGMLGTLGARRARVEFDIATPASVLATTFDAYARAGVQVLPLASFNGRSPTAAEAANLGSWARAYGPGGTFWAAHPDYPASLAVARIEFGNESNQNWQYPQLASDPNWAKTAFYADMARTYALRLHDAATAIGAANPGVGLLAIGDTPGDWPQWMDALFAADPGLADDITGWVVHPYGPNWATVTDNALARARSHGAPDSLGVYVTEFGISTDDGRCLSDNYGWDRCTSYAQAATALTGAVTAMKARYGSRLKELDLYSARDLAASSASSDRESYFGALTSTGTPKGAFTAAIQTLLATG